GVLHGSDLVGGEPLSRATSDLLAGLSKQEGDAVLNAVHNACHASIFYRCSLYTRSLASAFREPACQRRARSNLRWEGPEELLLRAAPTRAHVRLPSVARPLFSQKRKSIRSLAMSQTCQELPCPLPPSRVVDVA